MRSAEPSKINDPATMRALSHPARLELLEYLSRNEDGATATECAEVIGLSPSATSYHLRALAKVGMIRDAPGRGDGRERLWQASHRQYSIGSGKDASADDLAAETTMVETVLARQNEKVRRFLNRARPVPPAWLEAVTITDQTIVVTADELVELLARVEQLVEPLRRPNRPRPPMGARPVSLQLRAVPLDE